MNTWLPWAFRFRLRHHLRGSMWFVPLIGAVLGALLAEAVVWSQRYVDPPAGWHYSASTASGVLIAIVGAMVGLLGFVVTVGVLVVQQATGTLSPRYMQLWHRDRLQKAVLAMFAGSFTYAFSLLRHVRDDSVPNLGVAGGGVAVAASLVLLLVYLNRFTHSLRPVTVAEAVARSGDRTALGWAALLQRHQVHPAAAQVTLPAGAVVTVAGSRAGALQAIHAEALLDAAVKHDCLLVFTYAIGDFVPPGATLIEVHGASAPDPKLLQGLVALGQERTITQDSAFAVRILVDIAIKALSAAINDPTTAVQVLGHLEAHLRTVAAMDLRESYTLADEQGRARVIVPGRTWDDYLQLAVTEIRECGETSMQVCRRLRSLLEGLLETTPARCHPAVRAELSVLDERVVHVYTDPVRRALAQDSDRQGIGGGRSDRTAAPPQEFPPAGQRP